MVQFRGAHFDPKVLPQKRIFSDGVFEPTKNNAKTTTNKTNFKKKESFGAQQKRIHSKILRTIMFFLITNW